MGENNQTKDEENQTKEDLCDIQELLQTIDSLFSATDNPDAGEANSSGEMFSVDLDELRERGFYDSQLEEIQKGINEQLPVERYAKDCYNWKQMYELRLGLQEKIDISVYENPLYSAEQMKEIRMGLENNLDVASYAKLMFAAADMRSRRQKLMTLLYQECPRGFERTFYDDINQLKIYINDDCMEASLEVCKECPEDFSVKELMAILRKQDITYGLIMENLQKLADEKIREEAVVVARGTRAGIGKNGWFDFFFQEQLPESPKVTADGKVDYTNIVVAEMVSPGQILAQYHKSQTGKDGMTVTGIPVEGKGGKELPHLMGVGVRRDPKRELYTATVRGYASYNVEKAQLNVWKVYVVQGDVNRYNGNITYDGTIQITGSVNDLACIQANGDIIVDGVVGAATLQAGQNVIIKRGVNAAGGGNIQAGGKVMGNFFEMANIKARERIEGNYFLNCSIETDDKVIARGKKARIIGGSITAAVAVESAIIGNYGSTKTVFNVGDVYLLDARITQQDKLLVKAQQDTDQLEEGKQKLEKAFGQEAVIGNDMYEKVCDAIETKNAEEKA